MATNNRFSTCLLSLFLIALSSMAGCTVRYVAEYDASIKAEIVDIAKRVDLFWGTLLDTPTDQRQYTGFSQRYNEIETDIRGLLLRNRIRALNEISAEQTETLLDLWVEDKEKHKQDDGFSDFLAKRHREQYVRLFTALARGEEAKNVGTQ